jgi:hypothetical protein
LVVIVWFGAGGLLAGVSCLFICLRYILAQNFVSKFDRFGK